MVKLYELCYKSHLYQKIHNFMRLKLYVIIPFIDKINKTLKPLPSEE